jgi:hypothetical protein
MEHPVYVVSPLKDHLLHVGRNQVPLHEADAPMLRHVHDPGQGARDTDCRDHVDRGHDDEADSKQLPRSPNLLCFHEGWYLSGAH